MSRDDANRIALRAARSILDAAVADGSFELPAGDVTIAVKPRRLEPEPWPTVRLDGITEAEDGPWPAPVELVCEWPQGSCVLRLAAAYWKPNDRKTYMVSLWVTAPHAEVSLVWLTVANHIGDTPDGGEAQVWGLASVSVRKPEYARIRDAINAHIRELTAAWGVPTLPSGARIDVFRVRVPDGAVLPSPEGAVRTLTHQALLKLPFFDRGETRAIRGRSYVDVDALIREAHDALDARGALLSSGKQMIVPAFPGGRYGFKASLDRILTFVQPGVSRARFDRFIEDELEWNPGKAADRIARMGLAEEDEGALALTERGRGYLAEPTESRLFAILHEAFEGVLATLVITARDDGANSHVIRELLDAIADLPDLSQQQVHRRRDWLASLRFTERTGGADRITPAGRAVLADYADEVAELQTKIEAHVSGPEAEGAGGGEEEVVEGSDGEGSDGPGVGPADPPDAPAEPSNWSDDRLDLRPEHIAERAGKLSLPAGLLDQVCAALSTGKHLLLVGPPGTGKTELANAVARAAQDQGYCAGLFAATASADWSTYETIGGYALMRDGALRFRPGALLRAVERWQWLLVDELNRADVDKAFGELLTVLSGKTSDTPYELDDGRTISIGPDERCTHVVPKTFRVLATMNTWDKTSLFRLSYAVQRRFAIVHLGLPSDEQYAALLADNATEVDATAPALDDEAVSRVQRLFSAEGMLVYRQIGPAVAKDMVWYMRRRAAGGDGLAEAMAMFLLPQLEGLDDGSAAAVWARLAESLDEWAANDAIDELRARYRELFPRFERGK